MKGLLERFCDENGLEFIESHKGCLAFKTDSVGDTLTKLYKFIGTNNKFLSSVSSYVGGCEVDDLATGFIIYFPKWGS